MTPPSIAVRYDMDAPAGAPCWMLFHYSRGDRGAVLIAVSRYRYASARLALGVAHAVHTADLDGRRS